MYLAALDLKINLLLVHCVAALDSKAELLLIHCVACRYGVDAVLYLILCIIAAIDTL